MDEPEKSGAGTGFPVYRWLKRGLMQPRADLCIIAASVALLAPSLNTPLFADDYVHKLILMQSREIEGLVRAPLDLFRFASGGSLRLLIQEGVVSWWDNPDAELAFWRPLTALTHYLDHRLWPDSGFMMHLHSLFWAWLVFWGVRSLYRALMTPGWFASLALYLYALDDARSWFVSWIAARNAVTATAFSVWALVFHHRYRGEQWKPGAWLAPLTLALALLCGEGSLAACAYLFAYALFLDRASGTGRLLSLAPYAVVAAAWLAAHTALGYGVAGSGLYADPLRDPRGFLLTLYERAPILWFSQLGGLWSDLWNIIFLFPDYAKVVIAAALVWILAVGALLYPLCRREPAARFAALGALLSTFSAAAAFPADRLLSWIGIGASMALAYLIGLYIDRPRDLGLSPFLSRIVPAIVLVLVVANLVVAPVFLPSRARGSVLIGTILERAEASIPRSPDIAGKVLIYANPPGVPMASYIPIMRAVAKVPRPRAQHWLAVGTTEVSFERTDAYTLRVRPRGGFLLNPADLLFRSPLQPLRLGQKIDLGVLTVIIEQMTPDQRPADIRVRFSTPLEHPSLYWLRWGKSGYIPFKPPDIGRRIILPAADFLTLFLK